MNQIVTAIQSFNRQLGKLVAWCALLMVVVMSVNVLLRYGLAMGEPWQQELVRYFHAMLFLLGAAYAYQKDAHVRVDVLYQHMSARGKAWVNMLGALLLLLPLCVALIYASYDYVLASWQIWEGSSEYHGMPGVFLLKSCIWLSAITLGLEAIAVIYHSFAVIAVLSKYNCSIH